jgi:excinuclease ABC subunit B
VANVIEEVQRPLFWHNKTLAAQLYSEFKQFFQKMLWNILFLITITINPEAFMPVTGVFIEKDLSINEELEKMRMSTTASLLSVEEIF